MREEVNIRERQAIMEAEVKVTVIHLMEGAMSRKKQKILEKAVSSFSCRQTLFEGYSLTTSSLLRST